MMSTLLTVDNAVGTIKITKVILFGVCASIIIYLF